MEISRAIATVEEAHREAGSVSGTSALSERERIFVDVFIVNGGKGTDAALAAGCPEGSAHVEASRMLCRKRVADAILARCQTLVQSALPVAIKALLDIASDETAMRKDRIKAATSLLEHGGMAAPKGGVQVNVGVAVNGQQAQQIIASVHEARTARLSDIAGGMSDSNLRQIEQSIEALASPADDQAGGGRPLGPHPESCPLPVYSDANCTKSDVSGPADEFKRAFDDGDEADV